MKPKIKYTFLACSSLIVAGVSLALVEVHLGRTIMYLDIFNTVFWSLYAISNLKKLSDFVWVTKK